MLRGRREVLLPTLGRREEIPIYVESKITPGSRVHGPALVEAIDTTLLVPPGVVAERDGLMNLILTKEGE